MSNETQQTAQGQNPALLQVAKSKKTLHELLTSDETKRSLEDVARGLMSGERLAGILWQCCQKTPELMQCTPASLISATKTLVQCGCEPDGVNGFLVPFKKKRKWRGNDGKWNEEWLLTVTPVPSARGLMRMARSNGVQNLNIGTVLDGDQFSWGIHDGKFTMSHVSKWGNSHDIPVGYYCSWTDAAGYLHGERMSREEVEGIKARSKSKDEEGNVVGPWADHFNQMGLKTVIKRASKQWDLPYEFQVAMQEADDAEFGNNLRDVTPRKTITGLMDSIPKSLPVDASNFQEEERNTEGEEYPSVSEAWGEEPEPEQKGELPL